LGWPTILPAGPRKLIALCNEFLAASEEPEVVKAPVKKTPKLKKTPKPKKTPVKAAEEEDAPVEEAVIRTMDGGVEEEPIKKTPVRRRRKKKSNGVQAESGTQENVPTPEVVSAALGGEVHVVPSDLLLNRISELESLIETVDKRLGAYIDAQHVRIRCMVQQLWQEQRKMILNEDYLPPEKLDDGE
jgi:hypothetical protein